MTAAISKQRSLLWRRWQEVRLIGQDPVLAVGLIAVSAFVFLFVALPLIRVIYQGFFDPVTGEFSLKYFQQFSCLLYTSDAADERSSGDLGGRRLINKKKKKTI